MASTPDLTLRKIIGAVCQWACLRRANGRPHGKSLRPLGSGISKAAPCRAIRGDGCGLTNVKTASADPASTMSYTTTQPACFAGNAERANAASVPSVNHTQAGGKCLVLVFFPELTTSSLLMTSMAQR